MKAQDFLMKDGEYADLYIVDHDYKWTFVVTHEQGWIGPFFLHEGGLGEVTFLRIIPFVFFLSLSLLAVYIYYLHFIGDLQKTILDIWSNHQFSLFIPHLFFNGVFGG